MKEADLTPKWYPFYTRSRFEKKVYESLIKAGYEAFLPLKKTERFWSDRKKIVEVPLINSYVFVKAAKFQLYDIVRINGVVRYVSFNNQPATIRDSEIELIKSALSAKTEIDVLDGCFTEGAEVHITSGVFKGYVGKVTEFKGKSKIVLAIESVNKTLMVTVDVGSLTEPKVG